jgi:chromosome segregation ATPase
LLNMSHDMFKHILALNTYTEPFLSVRANDQRAIIEQLLGITTLSEKADALKEQNKATKDAIVQEEFRIKAVTDANTRIEEQINALVRRQNLWTTKKAADVTALQAAYDQLAEIDIEAELDAHNALTKYNEKAKKIKEINALIKRCEADEKREIKDIEKIKEEIKALENHTCHSCGQAFHDEKHEQVLADKKKALQEASLQALATNTQYIEHTDALEELGELVSYCIL